MSFDALAPHYRWMERVFAGNLMQRHRTIISALPGSGSFKGANGAWVWCIRTSGAELRHEASDSTSDRRPGGRMALVQSGSFWNIMTPGR